MKRFSYRYLLVLFFGVFTAKGISVFSQNKLPLVNGSFEGVKPDGVSFWWWNHQKKNGARANFSIATSDLIAGSQKALKTEV
ncbi:MAG: hypothetical protein ACPH2K_06905, partial [Flavicella sp.]